MFKTKTQKKLEELEISLEELNDEISLLYEMIDPKIPGFNFNKDIYLEETIIPEDVYDEIFKLSENKKCIFMGIA